MKKILFVCTGNTCRSPMAELYFDHECARRKISGVAALSAGIATFTGLPISEGARATLATLGIDSGDFRSRALDAELAAEASMIVAMGESHRRSIVSAFPDMAAKTRLLLEFSGRSESVPDPFGSDPTVYAAVFSRMRPALDALLDRFADMETS